MGGISVRAGPLRHRVTIRRPDTAKNEYGEKVEGAGSVVATVRAKIRPLNGSERMTAAQVQAGTTHEVTIRYLPGVDEACWFEFEGRKLNIDSMMDDQELNRMIVCMCKESR